MKSGYLGIAGTTGGGSVSLRRSLGSLSRRWEANSRSFQFSSGCDPAGNPFTTGAANCIAVWFRILTTKSRISTHFARTTSGWFAAGAGQISPHLLQLQHRTKRAGIVQNLPHHGQILRAHLSIRRDRGQRRASFSERASIPEAPCSLKIIRIIGGLLRVETE